MDKLQEKIIYLIRLLLWPGSRLIFVYLLEAEPELWHWLGPTFKG